MSTITLTDPTRDTLTVKADEDDIDGLNILVEEDGQETEVFWASSTDPKAVATKLRDFLSAYLNDREPQTANEAKLAVAAEHGLRAKFDYTGEDDYGRSYERRVEVDAVWDADNGYTLVGGESYDEDGEHEGYRQFRLDRIVGSVVVR